MSRHERIGVWIVGARGSVALCTVAGAAAMRAGLIDSTGLVSAREPFADLDLADPGRFVFGGHELAGGSTAENAEDFHRRTGVMNPDVLKAIRPALRRVDACVRPGFSLDGDRGERAEPPRMAGVLAGKRVSPARLVARVQRDLEAFRAAHRLSRVIVIYLATTEGPAADAVNRLDLKRFQRRLGAKTTAGFTASLLYAWAAIDAGFPFVNFTPSPAAELPALAELAALRGVPVAGNDGKTGETLVKTVLAPMFVARNLKLKTWFGYNLLGNADGESLVDPSRRMSKLRSKDTLSRMVDASELTSKVTIDYAPSLHDWKTAWDFIHFEGFLGTRMSLQFCWHGADSALAAPLVLDLVRFTDLSARRGETGPLRHLASFFKSPLGVEELNFHRQFELLLGYAARARERSTPR